jgi:hypothetical protein
MSRQQSQKKGSRSEGQKLMRAREGYESLPPSQQAGGAFAGNKRKTFTDRDVSLKRTNKSQRVQRSHSAGDR